MKPQRPYRALRAAVGTVAILALLGIWVHSMYAGQPLDTLWQLAVLIVILGGAVADYGKDTFDQAAQAAKDVAGNDPSGDGGGAESTEQAADN